jgi:hypothetical protein
MKFVKLVNIACLVVFISACGKDGGIFNSVKVTSEEENGQLWISAESEVNVGNLQFAAMTIPIMNPKNPSETLGRVTLQRSIDSKNMLLIDANLTALSKSQLQTNCNLPSGQPVPISGMALGCVPFGGANSRLYIGAQNNTIVLGAAVAISAFDNIGRYVPGVNLFWDIPSSNGVSAIGGAFTGPQAGQNGLALFMKVTQQSGQVQMLAQKSQPTREVLLLSNDKKVSSRTQYQLYYRMQSLDQRTKLRMH